MFILFSQKTNRRSYLLQHRLKSHYQILWPIRYSHSIFYFAYINFISLFNCNRILDLSLVFFTSVNDSCLRFPHLGASAGGNGFAQYYHFAMI